ncbi:helix-turn-helix transcriptional regulator [Dokdonella soli]|uniref:HTH cro/C1-type domain-containing protein n=1 Tax=Dokdonella soli TaxID=529810 RepID=A0ABP3U919_9GAMM
MVKQKRRASDRTFLGPLSTRIRHARRLAELTQSGLAKAVHVGPSAVAQWELPNGTSPTIDHLKEIAVLSGVAFEWLATGRGPVALTNHEAPAVDSTSFATDQVEDRLLVAFRRVPSRRRVTFVRWMEDFF